MNWNGGKSLAEWVRLAPFLLTHCAVPPTAEPTVALDVIAAQTDAHTEQSQRLFCPDPQRTLCGGECVLTRNNPDHCGSCGHRCLDIEGSPSSCVGAVCAHRCGDDWRFDELPCLDNAERPRQLFPNSLGEITVRRPTLRWTMGANYRSVIVELCHDHACADRIESQTVEGTSVRVQSELAPNTVVFWRLLGNARGQWDPQWSHTWEFRVPASAVESEVERSGPPHLDLNEDGFDDVVIGFAATETSWRMLTIPGGPSGISQETSSEFALQPPGSNLRNIFVQTTNVGDLDGDGAADIVVSEPYDGERPDAQSGRVFVYYGEPRGLRSDHFEAILGQTSEAYLCRAITALGDANQDGYADFACTSRFNARSLGQVNIFYGSPTGISLANRALIRTSSQDPSFASNVASGDFDGDRLADYAVAAIRGGDHETSGRVAIYLGSQQPFITAIPSTLHGRVDGAQFGSTLSGSSDFNHDGYADLVVRSLLTRATPATVQIFHGSPAGLIATAHSVLSGQAGVVDFAVTLPTGCDVNGDGYDDLVVGTPSFNGDGSAQAGQVLIYHGGPEGISAAPTQTLVGPWSRARIGTLIQCSSDINNDGFDDLLLSANRGDFHPAKLLIFLGSSQGIRAQPSQLWPQGNWPGSVQNLARSTSGRRSHRLAQTTHTGPREAL